MISALLRAMKGAGDGQAKSTQCEVIDAGSAGGGEGAKTKSGIAQEHQVHPVQIDHWRKRLLKLLSEVNGHKAELEAEVRRREPVERKVG